MPAGAGAWWVHLLRALTPAKASTLAPAPTEERMSKSCHLRPSRSHREATGLQENRMLSMSSGPLTPVFYVENICFVLWKVPTWMA